MTDVKVSKDMSKSWTMKHINKKDNSHHYEKWSLVNHRYIKHRNEEENLPSSISYIQQPLSHNMFWQCSVDDITVRLNCLTNRNCKVLGLRYKTITVTMMVFVDKNSTENTVMDFCDKVGMVQSLQTNKEGSTLLELIKFKSADEK